MYCFLDGQYIVSLAWMEGRCQSSGARKRENVENHLKKLCRKQSFLGFSLSLLVNLNDLSKALEGDRWCWDLLSGCTSARVLVAESILDQISVREWDRSQEFTGLSFYFCSHHSYAYLDACLWSRKFSCQGVHHQTQGCISELLLGSGS